MFVKITDTNRLLPGQPIQYYYFTSLQGGPFSFYAPIGTVLQIPRAYFDEQCMTRMGPCLGPGLFPFPGNNWSQADNANYVSWAQFGGGQPCDPIYNE
jgi:hypothetical protein